MALTDKKKKIRPKADLFALLTLGVDSHRSDCEKQDAKANHSQACSVEHLPRFGNPCAFLSYMAVMFCRVQPLEMNPSLNGLSTKCLPSCRPSMALGPSTVGIATFVQVRAICGSSSMM